MARRLPIFAIIALTATLGACAATPKNNAPVAEPFYVPTTLIVQRRNREPAPALASALAFQVLPAANEDEIFVPRGEKFAYGPFPISEISSYSILTYDAQPISTPNGTGFRYTWAVREGVAFP